MKTIKDLGDVRGKRVLVRSDLNVPLDGETITDDGRIRASLPTISALADAGARVVVCAHLGRPKGAPDPQYSLAPVAAALGRGPLPTHAFPWWLMRMLAPFGGFPREAADILPVWRHPVRIDNSRTVELLGAEPRTPVATPVFDGVRDDEHHTLRIPSDGSVAALRALLGWLEKHWREAAA